MLRIGLVGLPNAGKSTLFNALVGSRKAHVASYPFCTIQPNVGVIEISDNRLYQIRRLFDSARAVSSAIEFVDIAGLVAGSSSGEGLGNRFLGHIREVDAIAHVVRCFNDGNVLPSESQVDPVTDAEVVETELLLADLNTIEKRRERTVRRAQAGEKDAQNELVRLERFQEALNSGAPARALDLDTGEYQLLKELFLLTNKSVIYVINTDEESILSNDVRIAAVKEHASNQAGGDSDALVICADLEAEVADLETAEATEFLREAGITERGIDKLVRQLYQLLGLITFFTANETEAHAWAIPRGTAAAQAAGRVHSDIERGFIGAEVVSYADLQACSSITEARNQGLSRIEGRDYQVCDGDVILFRFR